MKMKKRPLPPPMFYGVTVKPELVGKRPRHNEQGEIINVLYRVTSVTKRLAR